MTNQIFSPKRFADYFKLFIGENWKKLLTTTASLVGSLIVVQTLLPPLTGCYDPGQNFGPIDPMWHKSFVILWIMIFVSVVTWSGSLLLSYRSKNRRFSLLTLPASNCEKFLTYFLIYIIGIYVIFFFGMELGNYLRVWTAPLYAANDAIIQPLPLKYFLTFGRSYILEHRDGLTFSPEALEFSMIKMNTMIAITLGSLFILQSVFALCSTIWPKSGTRNGILVVVILLILSSILINLGRGIFFGGTPITERFDFYNYHDILLTIHCIGTAVICLILYGIAYLRFKELETINRW